jgi:hypothetical protein
VVGPASLTHTDACPAGRPWARRGAWPARFDFCATMGAGARLMAPCALNSPVDTGPQALSQHRTPAPGRVLIRRSGQQRCQRGVSQNTRRVDRVEVSPNAGFVTRGTGRDHRRGAIPTGPSTMTAERDPAFLLTSDSPRVAPTNPAKAGPPRAESQTVLPSERPSIKTLHPEPTRLTPTEWRATPRWQYRLGEESVLRSGILRIEESRYIYVLSAL